MLADPAHQSALAAVGRALADDGGRHLLQALLDGSVRSDELTEQAGAPPTMAGHVSDLRRSGLITATYERGHVRFELADGRLAHAVRQMLDPSLALPVTTGHSHNTTGGAGSRWAVRFALVVLVPVALATVIWLVWLWPDGSTGGTPAEEAPTRVTGEVLRVDRKPCSPPESGQPPELQPSVCGTVTVRLTSGPDAGKQVTSDIPTGPGAPEVGDGDDVVLLFLPDTPEGNPYQIIDHQRSRPLWILLVAFGVAVVAFGRWRGLTALVGLAVSFAVLLLFIVPAILDGKPPLLVAIVGGTAIMLAVLYLTHGFTVTTTIAVLGTLASLILTGVLSAIATSAARLTGIASEETFYLSLVQGNVNLQGLLLAGILIGSLGVLDDVAVTQAATVTELARANPSLPSRELYRSATRIGRAHIASVINTIILAYAGASLPLLLLFAASDQPIGEVLTNPLIAQEVVRSVVGTIGLIAAVPITTALAAIAARHIPEAAGDLRTS